LPWAGGLKKKRGVKKRVASPARGGERKVPTKKREKGKRNPAMPDQGKRRKEQVIEGGRKDAEATKKEIRAPGELRDRREKKRKGR